MADAGDKAIVLYQCAKALASETVQSHSRTASVPREMPACGRSSGIGAGDTAAIYASAW